MDQTLGLELPLPKALADRCQMPLQKKVLDPDFATLKSYMLDDLKL